MKTRRGFVSNSSSTSFIITYYQEHFDMLPEYVLPPSKFFEPYERLSWVDGSESYDVDFGIDDAIHEIRRYIEDNELYWSSETLEKEKQKIIDLEKAKSEGKMGMQIQIRYNDAGEEYLKALQKHNLIDIISEEEC